jgi:hypothetical protein
VTGGPYTSDENTLLLLHGEGNFYNQSPLSDHANTTNGTVSFVDNEISGLGKAMYLDNSNGNPYLTVAHNSNLDLSSDWTIELWFKPVSYKQGLQYFIWKPGDNDPYFSNYSLQMNGYWNNELFCFYFSGDDRIGVNSQYVPDLNEWYHVAFIRNTLNGTLKIILRDSQREVINSWINQDDGIVPLTNMQDLNIGFNFDGYIDEIRISDVVRSFEISATEEKQLVDPIRIYPNPASDYLCIDTKENALVQIYSLTGQRVLSTQKTGPGNDIDLSGLQAGIYILSVHTSDQQLNKKLVIGK